MTLTAAQIVNTRRYMGYSVSGDTDSFDYREPAYSNRGDAQLSIEYRLSHLTPEEEDVLTTIYLANLALREQEVNDIGDTLDTDRAAVWYRNKNELSDRVGLFRTLRLDLCNFLGFPPGPALGGQNSLVRC